MDVYSRQRTTDNGWETRRLGGCDPGGRVLVRFRHSSVDLELLINSKPSKVKKKRQKPREVVFDYLRPFNGLFAPG
jgi:hypothetical protein